MGTKIVLLFINKSILLHFLAYKYNYEVENDVIKFQKGVKSGHVPSS